MQPLLQLQSIRRVYQAGSEEIAVLKNIDLTIYKGEMVAIIGSSGSGKSTLMNILGCLDKASSGSYRLAGIDIFNLDNNQLSQLRRNYFGFIFQRYHLLNSINALANVEIPAIYAGVKEISRKNKAFNLLNRLGLAERIFHKPNQLSGGQQQRVSIARALMNDGEIILADEPTGALDKQSGEDVLNILTQLHREGRTIILVTHDPKVASRAERIIEISDGEIINDYPNTARNDNLENINNKKSDFISANSNEKITEKPVKFGAFLARIRESFIMALLSLKTHPMRSFLTMLGIIIGIAAVIIMVGLGNGTQERIMNNINSMGSNSLMIFPGKSMSDARAGLITSLKDSDATALSSQPYVAGVSPSIVTNGVISYHDVSAVARIDGASSQIFLAQKIQLIQGRLFNEDDVKQRKLEAVIDEKTAKELFNVEKDYDDIIGKHIFIAGSVGRVIGVVKNSQNNYMSKNLQIYVPYTAVQTRIIGSNKVQTITLRIRDNIDAAIAEQAVSRILTMRHGQKDFFILNSEEFRKKVVQTMNSLTLLIVSIASISLLVGGIGVMNIMLVTVSERINEIGVRMAVGARRSDILQQFLIETVIVCMIGGALGIFFALAIGWLINSLNLPFSLSYSVSSIVISFIFSSLIGICFGFMPANSAAKMDPVAALSRD